MKHLCPRSTGTYADALQAIGTATLIRELYGARPVVTQTNGAFRIDWESSGSCRAPEPGFPYIWVRKNEPTRPAVSDVLDYETERQKRDAYNEWKKTLNKHTGLSDSLEAQGVSAPEEPSSDFALASILASMRKGWWADLELAKWLAEDQDRARAWAEKRLSGDSFVGAPRVTNSQILNPIAGKGVSAPKTKVRSAGSVPKELVDPFSEWMKMRGMWTAMLAYRNDDDFKFYVIEPSDIRISALKRVRDELRRRNIWGGVRLDIEATLRCAEVLIRHSERFHVEDDDAEDDNSLWWEDISGKSPAEVISGLRLAYFMSLGTAAALMNDSLMPLPGWFKINDRDDADAYLRLIDEAIGSDSGRADKRSYGCLASLNEKKSDDGAILQQFRTWLLTGHYDELLEFHSRFAEHLMQRFGSNDFARPFSTVYLDTLFIRGFNMKDIVSSRGFLSVARAVRNATIYAARSQTPFDVRFGLAQRWKQVIKSGEADFVTELSQFVQDYNWENIHRRESRFHRVSTEDLDDVIDLIGVHEQELIGSLLLAYGYSYRPRDHQAENDTDSGAGSTTEGGGT